MDASTTHPESVPLIDVSTVPLSELLAETGTTALAAALRRVIDSAMAEPGGDVSEFESSI